MKKIKTELAQPIIRKISGLDLSLLAQLREESKSTGQNKLADKYLKGDNGTMTSYSDIMHGEAILRGKKTSGDVDAFAFARGERTPIEE